MGCKLGWDREQLQSAVGKTFLDNEYKNYRASVLVERARSTIPQIQDWAMLRRDLEYVVKQRKTVVSKHREEKKAIEYKHAIELRAIDIQADNIYDQLADHNKGKKTRSEFMQKCGGQECEGFLSTSWKCRVCDYYTCKECGQVSGDFPQGHADCEHTCDEDEKQTFALVRQECKPCPGCASHIFKIEGCDQMFCTVCHIPWSWKTGQRVTGIVHNPHYYEWMRKTLGSVPRQPGDVPGGGDDCIDVNTMLITLRTHEPLSKENTLIRSLLWWLRHIEYNDLEELILISNAEQIAQSQRELVADFITKKITISKLTQKLIIKDKKHQYNKELIKVYETFVTVMKDQVRAAFLGVQRGDVVADPSPQWPQRERYSAMRDFNVYITTQLARIAVQYKYTPVTLLPHAPSSIRNDILEWGVMVDPEPTLTGNWVEKKP